MSATFEEISRDSVQLPRSKRLALARFLLELDDPAEDKQASDLWHAEILNRVQAVEEGKTEGVAYLIKNETIWILAIAHGHRRPDYWIDRRTKDGHPGAGGNG